MAKKYLMKPRDGLRIHDPITMAVMAPEGELKPKNQYWLRRIRDKDVILVDVPAEKAAPKKAAGKLDKKD